ncbi:MAG: 4Fe-4S dicluster domain-containing protein [Candidatus Korobacteraceae bacterium]
MHTPRAMSAGPLHVGDAVVVEREHLEQLFQVLLSRGYEVIGPTLREGAIVYDHLASTEDLPSGWTDEQAGGKYRLKRRRDNALFGYVVGPHSWKKFLYPPAQRLCQAARNGKELRILPEEECTTPRYAFFGVRACELHAIAIQDKVFLDGQFVDPGYKARRESVFLVAVNCGAASGTCFCASMNTGPKATSGFDLALTELLQDGRHYFLVEVGSERGAEILDAVPHQPTNDADKQHAERILDDTTRHMGRRLDTRGIKELLYRNYEHPQWDNVAERCLTCANCTMVCPTCFCTTVEDVTDLTGEHAERWRRWDSCFTVDFSYIHGGSVRATPRSRYRQWMVHKLATWIDQFGVSGCVGCGRCITWCPVGIDITVEAGAIRENDSVKAPADRSKDSA